MARLFTALPASADQSPARLTVIRVRPAGVFLQTVVLSALTGVAALASCSHPTSPSGVELTCDCGGNLLGLMMGVIAVRGGGSRRGGLVVSFVLGLILLALAVLPRHEFVVLSA